MMSWLLGVLRHELGRRDELPGYRFERGALVHLLDPVTQPAKVRRAVECGLVDAVSLACDAGEIVGDTCIGKHQAARIGHVDRPALADIVSDGHAGRSLDDGVVGAVAAEGRHCRNGPGRRARAQQRLLRLHRRRRAIASIGATACGQGKGGSKQGKAGRKFHMWTYG